MSIRGLTSLIPTYGLGVDGTIKRIPDWLLDFDLQEKSGLVSLADNVAVPLGRDLVINGDFANWTGVFPADAPDGFIVLDTQDATHYWTDATPGARILTDGTNLMRMPTNVSSVTAGKTYRLTTIVSAVVANGVRVQPTGGIPAYEYTAPDTYVENFTALQDGEIFLRRPLAAVATDATVASITLEQTDILASSAFADPTNNPLVGADTGTTPGEFTESRMILKGYDGTAYTDLLSAEHNSILSPSLFGVGLFFKRPTWDTTERFLYVFYVDAGNYFAIRFTTNAGELSFGYKAEGQVLKQVTYATGSPTTLSHAAMSCDGSKIEGFVNGVSVGEIAIPGTIIGNATAIIIGAGTTTPTGGYDGGAGYESEFSTATTAESWLRIANSGGVA